MTLSTFSLKRTDASPDSLWGSARQLVVIVSSFTEERNEYLFAYGIDPDHVNPLVDTPVFERVLPSDGLGDFLSVLLDGLDDFSSSELADPFLLHLEEQSDEPVIASAVDVTNADPQPPGPKLTVVFALAISITFDQSLAAVAAYAA